MTTFHALPPELIDSIIDHTHSDRELLATCSSVCKAWFPAARHHLFSNINLNAKNAPSFVRLINSTASAINPFIQHVDAKDNCEGGRWVEDLFANLTSLPFITSISLTSSCDTTISQATLCALCSFHRLVKLNLAECEFTDFARVQELICSFPVLEFLSLEADWPEPTTVTATEVSPSLHLRELHLRCEMSHVLQWFLLQPRMAPIWKLTLYGLDTFELPSVSRYLRELGPALTNLTLLPNRSIYDSLSDYVDLSFNIGLQSLKLLIDCDNSDLRLAHILLSQIDSLSFSEVELSFYSVRQGPKVDDRWAELDILLSSPQFSSVTRTIISATSGVSLAKETLPRCDKRGILQAQHQ